LSEDEYPRTVKDEAEMHRMLALAPPGNLHQGLGFLNKKERFYLGNIWILGESVSARNKVINSFKNADKTKWLSTEDEIAKIIRSYPAIYNNFSAGTDGFRSKQITKANVSAASGPYMQPTQGDEKKPGWFSRNILRKKSQSVTD